VAGGRADQEEGGRREEGERRKEKGGRRKEEGEGRRRKGIRAVLGVGGWRETSGRSCRFRTAQDTRLTRIPRA